MSDVWVVMTGTQGQDEAGRVFGNEHDAQRYAATAREWHARKSEGLRAAYANDPAKLSDPNRALYLATGGYDWYAKWFAEDHWHMVLPCLAASESWPFGDDPCIEFWWVEKKSLGWRESEAR